MREMHFLEILTKNSEIFRPYFCYCSCSQFKLTAERLIRMFSHVIYSSQEEERDMWNKETSTFMMFENVLDKCEDGDVDCSLSDILAFVTGLSMIPPLGFTTTPILRFGHKGVLPTASTCLLTLRIPTCFANNEGKFEEGFKNIIFLGQV
eukprot:m.62359 g.62359  ORF g.62359 m.62359 type:complete len:150 (+) comp35059_c0_seq4:1445-1894(+)